MTRRQSYWRNSPKTEWPSWTAPRYTAPRLGRAGGISLRIVHTSRLRLLPKHGGAQCRCVVAHRQNSRADWWPQPAAAVRVGPLPKSSLHADRATCQLSRSHGGRSVISTIQTDNLCTRRGLDRSAGGTIEAPCWPIWSSSRYAHPSTVTRIGLMLSGLSRWSGFGFRDFSNSLTASRRTTRSLGWTPAEFYACLQRGVRTHNKALTDHGIPLDGKSKSSSHY